MDFRPVNISSAEDEPRYVSVPDPDRYEYISEPEIEGFVDRLDPRHLFFPMEVVFDILTRAAELPVTNLAPKVDNSDEYIASRAWAIRDGISHGVFDPTFRNSADEELKPGLETLFVIASIDLVGSTILSQQVNQLQYARIIQTYSHELARLCEVFHGRPLKFMGDGAILYFPVGSVARKHDMAIDCALSLRDLVHKGINPALAELGLPLLSCRIGIDSGDAHVVTVGNSASTNHADIIGAVVNIATKVEKAAPNNGICFGEAVILNMHTLYLKHVVQVEPSGDWPYKHSGTDEPYKIYMLNV